MVLGFCLPGLGTPVPALIRDGFHRTTNEGEPPPPGQTPGAMQAFETVKRSKKGAKAWVLVVARHERSTLIIVRCLSKKGIACETSQLAWDQACRHRDEPAAFVCRTDDKSFSVSQCGNNAFVVTGEKNEDEDREQTCGLLKASTEGRQER